MSFGQKNWGMYVSMRSNCEPTNRRRVGIVYQRFLPTDTIICLH